jgi:hypothetical protein
MMYFSAGLHYQIAARYATIAHLIPESGNLAHHALEFYLKGALINNLDEAARRKLQHNLGKMWRLYKGERNKPELDKFDETIRDISKFERIRYPEEILRLGMRAEIGFVRSPPYTSPVGVKQLPGARYQLALDEVDELVKLIFEIESINPAFYLSSLNKDAKQYLNYQNKFPMT